MQKNRNIYISCKIMENVCSASTTKEFPGSDPAKIRVLYLTNSALPVEADGITWSPLTWSMHVELKKTQTSGFRC